MKLTERQAGIVAGLSMKLTAAERELLVAVRDRVDGEFSMRVANRLSSRGLLALFDQMVLSGSVLAKTMRVEITDLGRAALSSHQEPTP